MIIKLRNTECGGLPIYTNGALPDHVTKYYLTRKQLPYLENNRIIDQGSVRMKQCKNKGVVVGGKVHDKDKGIIAQSVQHNRIHSLD